MLGRAAKKKLTKAELARNAALAVYKEAKSYRDGISAKFFGMGVSSEAIVNQIRTTFKASFDALENQFNTDRLLAESLPIDRTDWGAVANKAGEYRTFYSTMDEKINATIKLSESGTPTPPATIPTPPMPAGNQALAPTGQMTPTVVAPSMPVDDDDEGISGKLPLIVFGVGALLAVALILRKK